MSQIEQGGAVFNNRLMLMIVVLHYCSVAVAQVSPPLLMAASPRDESIFIQWENPGQTINHLVEYKETIDGLWLSLPQPVVTPGIMLYGLQNDVAYDVRVSRITAEGQSPPAVVDSIVPTENFVPNWCEAVLSTGQSLAIGTGGLPVLSTEPFQNGYMLNWGRTAFIPLVEPVTGAVGPVGETMTTGMLSTLSQNASSDPNGDDRWFISCLQGAGAVPYSSLMQGSDIYQQLMVDIDSAKRHCLTAGRPLVVRALTVVHGETDQYQGTTAEEYQNYLLDWQADIKDDVFLRTGQSEETLLLTDQMSSWMSFGSPVPVTALGQYGAIAASGGKVVLTTPKYIFDSVDWLSHMTNYSYRRLGEYYAKAFRISIDQGMAWRPLMPESATLSGNVITVHFNVPVPPLVLDTIMVSRRVNYGFEYVDDCWSAAIDHISIISPMDVEIALSNVPVCGNTRIRYAYTGVVGAWTGRHIQGAIGGNLRDSDSTLATYIDGALPADFSPRLENWCISFELVAVNDEALMIGDLASTDEQDVVVWPNPSCRGFEVRVPAEWKSDVRYAIVSLTEQQVAQNRATTDAGGRFYVETGELRAGAYSLVLSDGVSSRRVQLVLVEE